MPKPLGFVGRSIDSGLKIGLKGATSKAGLAGLAVGGGTLAAVKGKRMVDVNNSLRGYSGYTRSVARNLRTGKMTANNLSNQDLHIKNNMYKIASLLNTAFTLSYAKGIPTAGKTMKNQYKLNLPKTPAAIPKPTVY